MWYGDPMSTDERQSAMTEDGIFKGRPGELRTRAVEMLRRKLGDGQNVSELSPEDIQKLVHELQVHQIELEMQNDELRHAQLEIEESRDRYLELYDEAPVGYVTLNPKGIVLETNLTATRLLEKDRESLVNLPFSRLVCKEDADSFHLYLNHVIETGSKQTCLIKLLKKDGIPFHAQLETIPASGVDGAPTLCRMTVSDVSAQKKAEALLAQTQRLRSLGEMASGVAHHVNNTLQIVLGNLELTLMGIEGGDCSNIKGTIEQVMHASREGAAIISRLQSFARIRCEVSPTASKVLELSHVVNQAVELTRPAWEMVPCAEEKKTTLHLDLKDECFVRGKEDELFEVAVNLIKNAAEALPEGGEMTVSTRIEGNQVVFKVQDTGIGIPKSDLENVFDPFWSAQGLTKAGMGLSISYGIVSRHGGTISVESELGKGSTFTARLSLSDRASEEVHSVAEMAPLRKLTILAIDDSEQVVGFLKAALETGHHKVLTALSGPAALETFRDRQVDVVICDLGMPGMSGWELGKRIKEICRETSTAKPPFILLTGWGAQILEKDKITESCVDAVLEKPVAFARLLTKIQEAVRKSHGTSTGS